MAHAGSLSHPPPTAVVFVLRTAAHSKACAALVAAAKSPALIGLGTAPSLHTASMCQWRAHRPHPLGACDATSLILVTICPCSASGRVSLDPCALAPIDLSDAAWADPDGLEAAMAAVTGALHGDRAAVRRDQ